MKTATVSSIITNAASRAGLDGSSIDNLPTTTKTIMLDNFVMHLRDAWEFFDWPDLCRTELRTVTLGPDDDVYIALEQPAEFPMGEVFGVFVDNPATQAAPREVIYTLADEKIRLPADTPTQVYVRYRLQPTELSANLDTALATTIPQILADYCKFSLTGDLLTEDGQLDKAQVMYQRAELSIVKEMDKVIFQQRQPRRWTAQVSSY